MPTTEYKTVGDVMIRKIVWDCRSKRPIRNPRREQLALTTPPPHARLAISRTRLT